MRLNNLVRFCLVIAITLNSYAFIESRNGEFKGCTPSQESTDINKPEFYQFYNNLIKTESGLENEYANKIILRGVILDKQCLPISDASVKIWQQDEYGDTRYIKDEELFYKQYNMNYKMYREINGTGKACSNNNGQFIFITVPPARYTHAKTRNYIRISISHVEYPSFETKILLNNEVAKNEQFVTASLNKADSALYGVEVYDFKVAINADNKYRKY